MTRVLALLVALFPAVTLTLAEDQSRQNQVQEPDSLAVEAQVLKQDLSGDRSAPETPGAAVARLETKLEEAKRDVKGVQRLFKNGVLSKVEMEQRLLNVIQFEAELADARLAEARQKIADLQSNVASSESAKDQLASAKAALQQLSEATEAAKAKRERAELEAAEANVRRQQRLLKLGLAAQSDVDGAQEKLAELKVPKN